MPSNRLSQVAGFSGNLSLNANFVAGTIGGAITNIEAYIFGVLKGSVNDIGISANISGTNITGTTSSTGAIGSGYDLTGATGNLVGVFSGPTGYEVAGSFNLSGGTNTDSVIGSFGAGQSLAAVTLTPPPTANFFSEEATVGGTDPNFTASNLKTGKFVGYTGALPNGVTGSPATANFAVTTVGGTVSGTAALGNPLQTTFGVSNVTAALLTVNSSNDPAIPAMTGVGSLLLLDETYALSYATFGGWDLAPSSSANNVTYVGVLAGGKPGVSQTAAGSMPTTGTATYSGGAFGYANQSGGYTVPAGSAASAGTSANWTGALNLTAAWSSNTLNGTITGINAYTVDGNATLIGTMNNITLASTISGSSVTGTASAASGAGTAFNIAGATGPLQAAFYGPAANEVAGTFHMTGGTNTVTLAGSFGGKQTAVAPSDIRLKADVTPAGMLPNGLRLYHWRYLGGFHRFTGVMAQDLARDPRFAGAVIMDRDGLMRVDYAAVGYTPADFALMQKEGEAAAMSYRLALH